MQKIILILLLLTGLSVSAQHKCKPGYRCLMGISTTDYIIEPGCYPDSTCNRLLNAFYKSMCLNGGIAVMDISGKPNSLSYNHSTEWNDSCGCMTKGVYSVLRGNKWVEITKKEYELMKRSKYSLK